MKYCRFVFEDHAHYGEIEERGGELWIVDFAPAPEEDLNYKLMHARATWSNLDFEPMPLSAAQLLAPVTPSKIVCVGRNYRDHAKELGNEVPAEPLLFFKPPSSLLAPGGVVRMPAVSERVDYEGELALVIGKRASRLKVSDDWRAYLRGYTIANDVTARDLQKKDGQWTRGKGFDTFCPVGPWWVPKEEVEFESLRVITRVSGEVRQDAPVTDMIFNVGVILQFVSEFMTLEPGDLIATGTPPGVGAMGAGDTVSVEIPGLGLLENPVVAAG